MEKEYKTLLHNTFLRMPRKALIESFPMLAKSISTVLTALVYSLVLLSGSVQAQNDPGLTDFFTISDSAVAEDDGATIPLNLTLGPRFTGGTLPARVGQDFAVESDAVSATRFDLDDDSLVTGGTIASGGLITGAESAIITLIGGYEGGTHRDENAILGRFLINFDQTTATNSTYSGYLYNMRCAGCTDSRFAFTDIQLGNAASTASPTSGAIVTADRDVTISLDTATNEIIVDLNGSATSITRIAYMVEYYDAATTSREFLETVASTNGIQNFVKDVGDASDTITVDIDDGGNLADEILITIQMGRDGSNASSEAVANGYILITDSGGGSYVASGIINSVDGGTDNTLNDRGVTYAFENYVVGGGSFVIASGTVLAGSDTTGYEATESGDVIASTIDYRLSISGTNLVIEQVSTVTDAWSALYQVQTFENNANPTGAFNVGTTVASASTAPDDASNDFQITSSTGTADFYIPIPVGSIAGTLNFTTNLPTGGSDNNENNCIAQVNIDLINNFTSGYSVGRRQQTPDLVSWSNVALGTSTSGGSVGTVELISFTGTTITSIASGVTTNNVTTFRDPSVGGLTFSVYTDSSGAEFLRVEVVSNTTVNANYILEGAMVDWQTLEDIRMEDVPDGLVLSGVVFEEVTQMDGTRDFIMTAANVAAGTPVLTYPTPSDNYNGSYAQNFQLAGNDSLTSIANYSATAAVDTMALTDITPTDINNAGNTVAEILNSTDHDPTTKLPAPGYINNIAVTGLNNDPVTGGKWQYSLDGVVWNDVGTVSTAAALLLDNDDKLRYVPGGSAPLTTQTADISFLAWNGTGTTDAGAVAMTAGNKIDTTQTITDGDVTVLSQTIDTATISITVTPGGVAASLGLWLKADDNGGVTTDGAEVSNWVDASGSGNDANEIGGDGNLPTYEDDATNSINFNPVILFNGIDDHLETIGDPLPNDMTNVSVFALYNSSIPFNFTRGLTDTGETWSLSNFSLKSQGFGTTTVSYTSTAHRLVSNRVDLGNLFEVWSYGNKAGDNVIPGTSFNSSSSRNIMLGETSTANVYRLDANGELIIYSVDLSDAEMQRIESYLALKYGTTLSEDRNNNSSLGEVINGSVTEGDYVLSDGTTLAWDYSAAIAFHYDIFGIGRDDNSALGQLKSKSVNTDAIVTLLAEGESTDDSNTPANYNFTDIADLEFLTIGNNDGAATWTSTGAPTGYQILTRQWSVQETGDVGTVQLDFDVADGDFDVPALLYGGTSYYFIYDSDNDGDLSDETPSVLTDQGGDVWRKTAQAFADGMEFTLATQAFDTSDAPVSYGDANHGVSSTLYLGSTAGDFDSAAINTANADGDDLSGDDEQTITFQSYLHDGGMTCVGTSGTYTTQTGEYCVVVTVNNTSGSTAQLVGWLDYDHDDAFGTAERSLSDLGGNGTGALVGNSSGGSADASYATGNILTGFSGNVVLVFTGLGDNDTQLGISSMLRLRITSDSGSDFFSAPTPSTSVSDGEVEDQFVAFGVLPVSLTSFNSSLSGKRLNADWSTASELFNIGFQLWGLDGATNQWTALHRRVVRSRNGNSVEPQIYRKRVRLPSSISELKAIGISTLDASGEEHYYGPFEVGKSYGDLIELESISWNRIRAEMDEQMIAQGYVKNRYGYLRQRGGSPVDSDTEQSVIEVSVSADGMYELTGAMLRQAGVDVNTLTRRSTAVVDSFGNPIARRIMARGPWISSDRTLGERGSIIFMGKAPQGEAALYSDVSVYRLIQDRNKAHNHQLQRRKGVNSGFSEFYYDEVMLEQQTTYNVSSQADDPWQMGSMIFARSVKPVTVMKTLNLPADVLEDKGYTLLLGLGRSSSLTPIDGDENGVQDPEHIVQGAVLSADGSTVLLDEAQAVGKGQWDIELPVVAGTRLKDEDNQAQVGGIFRPGAGYRSSLSSLDYVGLRYARSYKSKLENKYLHFTSPSDGSSGYEVEIPAGAMVSVYAVSGDNVIRIRPEMIRRYSRDGQRRTLVRFAALQGLELLEDDTLYYWVSVKGGYLTADHIEAKQVLSEASVISQAVGKDYVLIAHPAFMGADSDGVEVLNDYATFKVGQGYNAAIVNYLDIVSSFGGGQAGPHGLTRYLAALSALGSLKHTVLVGGGSYDYLDYLGSGGHSFIPSYYRLAGDVRYTATDAPYVQDEQGIMLSSVGRLPVRELSELRFLVDKTISWGNREASAAQVLLLAENKDKRHDFKGSANSLSGILAHESNQISIYIDDLLIDNPELSEAEVIALAKSQLLDNINEGIDQIIYVGHSSPDRLMKKNIFNATDAGLLGEANPNMWLSLACYVTYYESTHVNTLAHQLLFSGNAVNITGPMYLSSLGDNEAYARGIINGMNAGKPIGESVGDVKEASSNQSMIINWSLLGDPTNLLTN